MAKLANQFSAAVESHRRGDLARAGSLYRRILKQEPAHPDALHLLGLVLAARGDASAGLALIGKAVEIRGPVPEYCANMARVFLSKGAAAEAAACFRQALRGDPLNGQIAYELGVTLAAAGQAEDAALALEHALELLPANARTQALYDLGVLRMRLRRWQAAAESFREVVRREPAHADAHTNLGIVLHELADSQTATNHCRQALALTPGSVNAAFNLGRILQSRGELEAACRMYREVIGHSPGHVPAHTNAGNALAALRRFDAAFEHYRSALRFAPRQPETHWNLAMALFQTGRLEEAWPHYEYRFERAGAQERVFDRPRWDGSPLGGRRILIHAEQGLGDTIQFVRYVPMVNDRGGRVILECQPALVRLLSRTAGAEIVIGRGEPLPDFEVHAPLMSLPGLFGTALRSIPAPGQYLAAEPEMAAAWRIETNAFRTGLIWAGNPDHPNDRNRSIPAAELERLAALPAVRFFSLQKGRTERLALPRLVDLGAALDDFADTAAVVSQLDLVVSVDTAAAHLSAALGIPTWTLLPYDPDWRWMLDREDSPWYPSMRLFRQPKPGDWQSVLTQVSGELDRLAARRQPE